MSGVGGSRRADVLSVLGARGISILATFLLATVVARVLGPDQAGVFFLIFTILALFATAGRFGADNLALRIIGGDSRSVRSDVRRLLLIVALASLIAAVLCALLLPIIIDRELDPILLFLVASGVLAQSLAVVAGAIMRGAGKLASGVLAELGLLPALTTLGIVLVWIAQQHAPSLDIALVVFVVASWVTAAWSLPLAVTEVRKTLKDETEPVASLALFLRTHISRLLPMMATSLLAYAMVWAPVFVLSISSSMVEVSYYSVAMRVANIVALLPTIQISYLAPEFVRRFYAGDLTQLNMIAGRSAFQAIVLTGMPLVALIAFAPQIMGLLFGADFVSAAPLMVILCVGVFVAMAGGQVSQLMLLCGLERVSLVLTVLPLLLWATLGLWLSSLHGAAATAWLGAVFAVVFAFTGVIFLITRRGIHSYARFIR